ncbi:MAG: PDZ domain-containing protein [Ruminococcaceae bacterium]|nr:PDZ domain-containing protein [Oscillospiraceae bacterium]
MNEYQWYQDPVIRHSDTQLYALQAKKKKKSVPAWLVALLTAFGTTAVCLVLFSVFVVPHMRPSTTISYAGSSQSVSPGTQASDFSGVIPDCISSTASVSVKGIITSFFSQRVSYGDASGIIVSPDGYIVTSASMLESDSEITVTLSDHQEYPAIIIGADNKTDIAVLKIDAQNLTPAVLGDSSALTLGEGVIAIGSPLGKQMKNTVTQGIISGINPGVELKNGTTVNLLQTDATLNSANAGGALFNQAGQVIGIVSANISSSTDGIGFAIPVNDIKPVLESLIHTGTTSEVTNSDTPMLGITATDASYGVTVETVGENTPAEKGGIKIGDLIIKIDGTPVNTVAKINELRQKHQKGDTMVVTVFREGETLDLNIVLESE